MQLIISNVFSLIIYVAAVLQYKLEVFTNFIQIAVRLAIPGYCIERGKAYCESVAAAAASEKEMLL